MTGGTGSDIFLWASATNALNDTVTDWTTADDQVSLTLDYSSYSNAIDFNGVRTGAGVSSVAAAEATFTGKRGEYIYDTSSSKLLVNISGDSSVSGADIQVGLNAATTAADTVAAGDVQFTLTGTSKADTIVTGGGADTIALGAGADNVTGGGGADTITNSGTGVATTVITGTSDTFSSTTAIDTTAAGTVTTLTGIDEYFGFKATDIIDLSSFTGFTGADATTADGTTELAAATDGGIALINGSYVAATNKFTEDGTFDATDNDYLLMWADGTNYNAIVFVDVAAEIDSVVGSGELFTLTT
jgi:Ca2+-binding RTX toxin-like protein